MLDKELLALIGGNKKYIFMTSGVMLLGMLANIGITACFCFCISLVIGGAAQDAYLLPLVLMLLFAALRLAASVVSGDLRDFIGRRVKKDLRGKTYDKILKLGTREADGLSLAGLTQVSLEGIEQLDLYYSSYLPQFFFSLLAPVFLFALCVSIDARAAWVLLACVPLIPMSIVAVSKYAKKIFAKYWDKYISMGDAFLDSVQGLKELKIFRYDEQMHRRINERAEEFRKITMKVLVMQLASVTIMDLVAFGGAGIGIALTVCGAADGVTSPASALFLILAAVEFFLPLRALGSAFHVAMNGASAGKNILSLLKLPDPVWGDRDTDGTDLCLDHVTFSYDGRRNVLADVSLTVRPGEMIAVAGESGCGKSTVVSLLTGAERPQTGEVRIGGVPLPELSRQNYYAHIAVVSCGTYLFSTSVRENFRLANPDVTEEEMLAALKSVRLDTFLAENGGLDKPLAEEASNLSGGQKQRLALAVNLAAHKDIYIFDEATSNIDMQSEAIIMENIRALCGHAAVLVISHRLENIVPADRIYFMENGAVTESGSHAELMEQNGGYAALYRTQKSLEDGYKTAGKECRA